MIDCVSYYFENGLVSYELKNINNNLLQQKTSPDFVEWCNDQNFKKDTLYNGKGLFEDFSSRYMDNDEEFRQRGFTNWLKFYASVMSYTYENKTSNGETRFMFR